MTDLKTAAQQALEALKMMRDEYEEYACPACDHADAAIYALRAALAEPERRLTDADIGELWFESKIPGLTETNARLLIRAAERKLAGDK